MDDHLLLIPVTGLLEVIHVETHLSVPDTLVARGGTGALVIMDLTVDNWQVGQVVWMSDDTGQVNARAREAVVMLTGTYVIFTGPVMLSGVDPETVGRIVAALSRKEN